MQWWKGAIRKAFSCAFIDITWSYWTLKVWIFQLYLCYWTTLSLNKTYNTKTCFNNYQRIQMHPTTNRKSWNVLPAADRASRDSKQHTDARDFILAGRGLLLITPGYIYRSGWRSEGMPVEVWRSNCAHIGHCASEQLPGPIRNVESRGKREEIGCPCCALVVLIWIP